MTTETKTFTVVGLWVDDEPLVAAVLEGEREIVDSEDESGGFQRWGTSVEATDPDHAEVLACAELLGEDDEETDDKEGGA